MWLAAMLKWGQAASVGGALMAVVTTDQMWLDANFKETQLTHMRIDQPAEIHFDLYGRDKTFNGKVVGIEMGTGSAFSLLPTQMRRVTGSSGAACLYVFN